MASSEFGTYCLCEQRRFRRACASAQSRQNLRCSLIQAVSQEEPSDRKPDLWPLWMAGHAQLKFVMMECSKTQIRLTGLNCQDYQWRLKKRNVFFDHQLWRHSLYAEFRIDRTLSSCFLWQKMRNKNLYDHMNDLGIRSSYAHLTPHFVP